jgi:quercetin dioxygenase-like cupin family protein
MEFKFNEATVNRPEGSRIIDASWVFNDIETMIKQLRSENAWEKNDRNGITVFKTDQLSVVLTILKAGTLIENNSVNGLFMLHVLKGSLLVETGDYPIKVEQGNILNLHAGVKHSILAKQETEFLQITVL